jgi:hypothetical protein
MLVLRYFFYNRLLLFTRSPMNISFLLPPNTRHASSSEHLKVRVLRYFFYNPLLLFTRSPMNISFLQPPNTRHASSEHLKVRVLRYFFYNRLLLFTRSPMNILRTDHTHLTLCNSHPTQFYFRGQTNMEIRLIPVSIALATMFEPVYCSRSGNLNISLNRISYMNRLCHGSGS